MFQTSFIFGAGLDNNEMNFTDLKNLDYFPANQSAAHSHLYDIWPLDDLYYESSFFGLEAQDQPLILKDQYDIACWLCSQILSSASGFTMLEEAMNDGWSLALEDLNGPDFHLDVPQKLIILDRAGVLLSALGRSEYFRHILCVSFVRALRDVWQEKRHGGFSDTYGPEDILTLERVRAADLDVLAVLVAWEQRSEGYGGLWRYMIGSEDGDIAMRFSGYLERDPSALLNGKALNAAFVQWFRDPARIKACEHEILNDLDAMMVEHEDEDHYNNERHLPVFGRAALKPLKIETLSCLPDRSAYLQGRGQDILSDPLYAGMSDEVNQTHLMQILYDMKVVWVQNVPFRDKKLADRIFPNGALTVLELQDAEDE